jgi:hypothetical protein
MICPHCNYKDEYVVFPRIRDGLDEDLIVYVGNEPMEVFACPKCKKVFID